MKKTTTYTCVRNSLSEDITFISTQVVQDVRQSVKFVESIAV